MNHDDLWLSDLKILDLSRLLPGPFCTLLLADMGADVLKIEEPAGGDYARYFPPMLKPSKDDADDPDASASPMSAFFAGINRNKRSMTLNLKSQEGVEILRKLVADADILLESFRPGVMAKLGLDYETLKTINPRLIYCSISGYGQDGPMSQRAGHDLNYMARAGLLEQNGGDSPRPAMPGFQVADIAGGTLYAAIGILGALHRRHRTQQGSFLDISMTEGAMTLHLILHAAAHAGVTPQRGKDMLNGGLASYNIYETADEKYLAVAALEPKFWAGFVQTIGAPELLNCGFSGGEEGVETRAKIARILREKSRAEWIETFNAVDVCVEPIHSPVEALEDELFRAREMFFELNGAHQTRTPLTPTNRTHSPAPTLGEHTEAVIDELGLGARMQEFRDNGVI